MTRLAVPLETLAEVLPAKARLIGVDLGSKTIGLALSDVERRFATPLLTISRVGFTRDAAALAEQVAKFDAFALIIGMPFNMEGDEGPRAQGTRAFARNYAQRFPLPIAFWDERLSTAAVTRDLIANDVSRSKRAEVIDKMAAAYILQGALDRLSRLSADD